MNKRLLLLTDPDYARHPALRVVGDLCVFES